MDVLSEWDKTDHAIGVSGIDTILHYEGTSDTFGKLLRVTATAIVDELCSAAELVMGKTKKNTCGNYQKF